VCEVLVQNYHYFELYYSNTEANDLVKAAASNVWLLAMLLPL